MTIEPTERLTYSIEETAKLLGISKNSCYLAVKTGQVPSLKIGSRILIPKAALEKMLAAANTDERPVRE